MKLHATLLAAALLVAQALSAQWGDAPQGHATWTSHDRSAPIDSVITVRTDSTFLITAVVSGKVHTEVWRKTGRKHWKHEGPKADGMFYIDFSNSRMLVSSVSNSSMTYVYYASLSKP